MKTNNNTLLFEAADLECEDNVTQAMYEEGYHPSYNTKFKRCEGFVGVPEEIDCESFADGDTLRLCNCISPCKYLRVFYKMCGYFLLF